MLEYTSPLDLPDYGRAAYEAYCKSSDGKSLVSGAELPAWDKLDWKIQMAWHEAALGAFQKLRGYTEVHPCPNKVRPEGEYRQSVRVTEERLGEILGIPWNHRVVAVEHDQHRGIVECIYELTVPLITGYGGMDSAPLPTGCWHSFDRVEGRFMDERT